jgi:hypothetical protein
MSDCAGLALCALVHKFRPRLLDYDKLNPKEDEKNIAVAFEAGQLGSLVCCYGSVG